MAYKFAELHSFEKTILRLLKGGPLTIEALSEKGDLTVDQVRRGVERLKFKNLILTTHYLSVIFELHDRGKSALDT